MKDPVNNHNTFRDVNISKETFFKKKSRDVGPCIWVGLSILILFIYTVYFFRKRFEVVDTSIDSDSGHVFI